MSTPFALPSSLFSSLFTLPFSSRPLAGGCINDVHEITLTDGRRFCVKQNASAPPGMFTAEAAGLAALAVPAALRVPRVEHLDPQGRFLVLEFIQSAPLGPHFWQDFGRRLARLHRHSSTHFGFDHDNWVGSTPQPNPRSTNWSEFYAEQRISYQLDLALSRGLLSTPERRDFDRLIPRLPALLDDDEPPSLIHGDLWSGNYIVDETGSPVLIDPAAYYAHREAEFGITTLFGGFPSEFFDAYNVGYPLRPGWRDRIPLYQLYHLLNHLNLFGGVAYLPSIRKTMERIVG